MWSLPCVCPTPGPLFLLSDGTPLYRQWLTSSIQSILSTAGVPGCYIGDSFLIGAATSAASCCLPDHLIKTLVRWSSDAYQIYIHTPGSTFVGVASPLISVFLVHLPPFLVVFVGCLWTLVVRCQGFPQPWASLSFSQLVCVSSESPFGLEWGPMAGLRGFASHGGSILSRGWLATVEVPAYPRNAPST